jgi:hypothetical protein
MQLGEEHLFYSFLAALAVGAGLVFIRWLLSGPLKADPWGEAVATQIEAPDSAPVCHRCFIEHSDYAHFCPQCGAAVGDFNNLMPYEYVFSEGEVLRNGTALNTRRSIPVIVGYLLLSLAAYAIFAPVYWYFLLRNFFRGEREPVTLEVHQ